MVSAPARIRDYVELTKPRILLLVIVSGIPPLWMATQAAVSPVLVLGTLLGIGLAGGAANALNCYVERDRDALMARTRRRPLPDARLHPVEALAFGLALAGLGTGILWWAGGRVAAALGIASILFYVFVYTVWLKPRSAWNAVIGGAAGASAPLIADAAVNGSVGAAGWILFAIIFLWQPPHVWAIALYRKADYRRAGIPMLPSVIGDEATRHRMLAYAIALLPVTLAPIAFGLLGALYGVAAAVLGGWFLFETWRVVRERTAAAARRTFHVSHAYLFALFGAMFLDLALR